MAKVTFDINENGCYIVTSHKPMKWGHCSMTVGSRTDGSRRHVLIHRLAYEECFGQIPDGLVVRHKCDNGSCINPEHLELGTQADNVNDTVVRGRTNKGVKHHNTNLTEDNVAFIKYQSQGIKNKDLAEMFNINIRQVFRIKSGERWGHI